MEITFRGIGLSEIQETEFARLLALSEHNPPTQEDMWFLMDHVWDEMECDHHHDGKLINRKANLSQRTQHYCHSVSQSQWYSCRREYSSANDYQQESGAYLYPAIHASQRRL